MKKEWFILSFILSLTLFGCSSAFKKTENELKKPEIYYTLTKDQIKKAEQKKLPEDYKTLVKQNFYLSSGNINKSKYIFYTPVRAYNPLTNFVFWLAKVEVSEKNWLGIYSRYKPYLFSSNGKGELIDITNLVKTSTIVIVDKFEKDENEIKLQ